MTFSEKDDTIYSVSNNDNYNIEKLHAQIADLTHKNKKYKNKIISMKKSLQDLQEQVGGNNPIVKTKTNYIQQFFNPYINLLLEKLHSVE